MTQHTRRKNPSSANASPFIRMLSGRTMAKSIPIDTTLLADIRMPSTYGMAEQIDDFRDANSMTFGL